VNAAKKNAAEQLETLQWVLHSGLVTDWRCAIDGGANVGDWTAVLADWFTSVVAFEPSPDTYAALDARFMENPYVEVWPRALLDKYGTVAVRNHPKRTNNRSRYVEPIKGGSVISTTIDLLNLDSCGLIKLDLEGAEYLALQGARKTILKHRPVLIVEIDKYGERYGYTAEQTTALIRTYSYRMVYDSRPDMVFAPNPL
jgi:FkbM family methyltransferase